MKCITLWLTGLLVVGTTLITARASLDVTPGSQVQGVIGTSSGQFELPFGGEDGFAFGTLNVGIPQFLMGMEIPADSVQMIDGALVGTMSGTLQSFPLSPLGDPFADVSGNWRANPETGAGFFTLYISQGSGPGIPGPTTLIGVVRGRFLDSPATLDPLGIGEYQAIWTLF